MPCMCGACDCPSCGPAQGYEVRRVWTANGWCWRNVEDDEVDDEDFEEDPPEDDLPKDKE